MQKKKKYIIIGLLCAGLILLAVFLSFHVSIAGEPWMAGGCVSVTFDKWDMCRADKVVVYYGDESCTVADPEFARTLAGDAMAGTYSDYCCAQMEDGWVEIYRGDRLIRRMRWIQNHDSLAYEADLTHWVLFGEEGHVFLSGEVGEQLREIMDGGRV